MKIFLTGASGFLGQALARRLASLGHDLVLPMRRPDAGAEFKLRDATVIPIPAIEDLSVANWQSHLNGVDAVIHAAAIAHIGPDVPVDRYQAVNRHAASRLAEAAAKADVKQFVFISSIRAQVGRSSDMIQSEKLEPRPTEAYGQSKLDAENDIRTVFPAATIFRPALILGEKPKGNLAAIIKLARLPLPLPFAGLQQPQAAVCLQNLVAAVVLALESPGLAGETFCVANSTTPTCASMIADYRRGMNRSAFLFPVPDTVLQFCLRLAGKAALAERLFNGLQVDASKLRNAGWIETESHNELFMRIGAERL